MVPLIPRSPRSIKTSVIDRSSQQFSEAQFPRPFIEILAVQRRALDLQNPQHIIPLPVGHAPAVTIPLKLG